MTVTIVLDSGPLGLLTQRPGAPAADQCRNWLSDRTSQGAKVVVPEIIDYEIRRELIRAGKVAGIQRLDDFLGAPIVTYLPLTTVVMRRAAELWASARQSGRPTQDPHALDIDVILAAQALSLGLPSRELIVATGNVSHLGQFVPADLWTNI